MKANELMIGDWVMSKELKTPVKVCSIMNHYETTIYFYYQGNEFIVNSYQFEPIPLTPKILEKNGFYRSEIPTRDEIGHYYHRKTAPSSIFVSISFEDGRDFGNEIKYVHQLQHALKICGIDKEITL